MSDKLTALPVITSLADEDLFYVVDVSDTTDDPAGSSVGIARSDIIAGPAPALVLLEEIELSVAGEFDFGPALAGGIIPQDYDRLIIKGTVLGDVSAAADGMYCFFNADTTASNYHYQKIQGQDGSGTFTEGAVPQIASCPAGTSPAGTYGIINISVEDYTGANRKMAMGASFYEQAVDNASLGLRGLISAITDPITRIRIRTDNHATDQLVGKLQLFGEKSISVVDSETVVSTIAIETITDPAAGEFDFTIPAGYDRVYIQGTLTTSDAGTTQNIYGYLNSDLTNANYHRQNNFGNDGAANVVESATPQIGIAPGTGSPSGSVSSVKFSIEDYLGPQLKTVRGEVVFLRDTDNVFTGIIGMISAITDPVTRIRIRTDDFGTDDVLGTLTLYGEKSNILPISTGGAAGTLVTEEIGRETLGVSDGGVWDFTIPSGYDRIILKGQGRSDNSNLSDNLNIYFNSDTTDSNYHRQNNITANGSADNGETAVPIIALINGGTSTSGYFSTFEITVEAPESGYSKMARSHQAMADNSASLRVGDRGVLWTGTAAITRIRLQADGSPTDEAIGTVICYGERTL